MTKELDYDGVNWKSYFKLDDSSPSGLSWNTSLVTLGGRHLQIWEGKPAGSLGDSKNRGKKTWSVSITLPCDSKSRSYKVHRIIMVLQGYTVNSKVVDHINGDSTDNSPSNLRVTTITTNARNCNVQHNSPYGIAGVGLQEDSIGNTYFISRWMQNGKRQQVNFPIKKLGVMEAFKQAVISRRKAISEINAKEPESMYTERHTMQSSVPYS